MEPVSVSLSRLLLYLAAIAVFALPGAVHAFHFGGVGDCGGCHTEHNPLGRAGDYLLIAQDASSTCLTCHERPDVTGPDGCRISTPRGAMPEGVPPQQMTPGGDFGWLRKDYQWVGVSGTVETSPGYRHGHNIVAAGYGYSADGRVVFSPGGSYPANSLTCISCHDPHGQYRILADGSEAVSGPSASGSGSYGDLPTETRAVSTYRLLGGAGYEPKSIPGFPFKNPSPAAVSPVDFNRSEAVTQTRVAYGSGMSEWCANCHERMLRNSYTPGATGQTHPAGKDVTFGAALSANYNSYVKSGDLSGSQAVSYLSLVPFETGDSGDVMGRKALLALARTDDTALIGPGPGSVVSCLTCHRAHASGWDGMLRWNCEAQLIVFKGRYPGRDNDAPASCSQGRTQAEASRAYYDIPPARFAYMQRPLCNKCHTKD